MVINPIIQICRHIHAGRIHKHNVVPQQAASFTWPKYTNLRAFAEFFLAQRIGQLLEALQMRNLGNNILAGMIHRASYA